MIRNEASQRQVDAADPFASTWLSANAGSGKTRVLTDRVARLLLNGVAPQRVLCLTYTKAAASEMQNRLFDRLGGWAMLPDAALSDALAAIGEPTPDADALARARRLFARAIETPGGLKIQTIHSFCAGLLRRFPIEAGVTPQFTEIDARAAQALRAEVLDTIAEGAHHAALARLLTEFTGAELDPLLTAIGAHAATLAEPPAPGVLEALFELPPGYDTDALLAEAFLGDEAALAIAVAEALDSGKPTDQKTATALREIAVMGATPAALERLEGLFLYGETAKAPHAARTDRLPTKAMQPALGALLDRLHGWMRRIEALRSRRLGLAALHRAQALAGFAAVFVPAYAAAKARRGWLDFDDLIAGARRLLSDPSVAQWVLYKLDGGVDHVLVDEAQDTAPAQWAVIELLAQEFTAGTDPDRRSLFVVGDKKQSIYSFQGADLRVFEDMRTRFAAQLAAVGVRLNQMQLAHSFRSSDAVLRVVDATFDARRAQGLGGDVQHIAFHPALPGRVDLWPAIAPIDDPDPGDWSDPVDRLPDEHHTRALARAIAAHLRALIDARTPIPAPGGGARVLDEGDVLILVRRRSALFHEIIRACKAAGLAIAGADRLQLGGEMAVRDLTALLRVLATPEDDLSLAAALRSPLMGWSEGALFDLAQGRDGFLWAELRATDTPARAMLGDLMDSTDFLRPYELLERVLIRHDGRRRLLARLGAEAEDGIDALLAQALAYERTEIPSLTGFLGWLDRGAVEIKRELDTADRRIRVMTVHGAKGLEAPLVILPDTARRRAPREGELFDLGDAVGWKLSGANPQVLEDARARARDQSAEEDARLLYVAMTRAETWLIVAAAGEVDDDTCWHARARAGVEAAGPIPQDFPTGPGLRHQHGDWPDTATAGARRQPVRPALPDWARAPAPEPARAAALLSPSALGGAKALAGEDGDADADALRRGTALHLLLEHLPLWPASEHAARAQDLLAATEDGLPADWAELLAEAAGVLAEPGLSHLFAPGTLAEVDITAELHGQRLLGTIDRLVIAPDRVLAVDYKSNRVIPPAPEDTPEGLLRQMGAYRAALETVFPGRAVDCALLWTRAPRLMVLPAPLTAAALARAAPPLTG